MLIGYLHGNPYTLADNSRSDDEPNVDSYLGRPINHQWTKSREFEAAAKDSKQRDGPMHEQTLPGHSKNGEGQRNGAVR